MSHNWTVLDMRRTRHRCRLLKLYAFKWFDVASRQRAFPECGDSETVFTLGPFKILSPDVRCEAQLPPVNEVLCEIHRFRLFGICPGWKRLRLGQNLIDTPSGVRSMQAMRMAKGRLCLRGISTEHV